MEDFIVAMGFRWKYEDWTRLHSQMIKCVGPQFYQPKSTGRNSEYVMCCSWAITMCFASWKTRSSSQEGLRFSSLSAIRLCWRAHNRCIVVRCRFSLALASPAMNRKLKNAVLHVIVYFLNVCFCVGAFVHWLPFNWAKAVLSLEWLLTNKNMTWKAVQFSLIFEVLMVTNINIKY